MLLETKVSKRHKSLSAGYDAVRSTTKRKAASAILKSEDQQLRKRQRDQLTGTGRDLSRNFSIVAWAVRKHLDYVTQFDFQMRTDDEEFNQSAETLVREWMRPHNCDIAGRHPFPRMLRMLEARRTIDNDVFLLKRSQNRLQAIEGDLIRDPDKIEDGQRWVHGCQINNDGRALNWGLHRRMPNGGYDWIRRVQANKVIQHAYFDRFDQIRGVSPLASAYNSFKDVYEGVDYALAKMKVEQLFAMVITSGDQHGTGTHTRSGDGYDVDFGKGPVKLEMEPGDDAQFLKTDNPGSNTREFLHTVLGIALKALDIPFNFYDESHTNFFGSRAAWLLYDRSCKAKRDDVLEVLRKITVWLFRNWIIDGRLRLPAGMTVNDLPFEWVHRGMPWWDPAKEINGDLAAISAGLDNPYRICKERGRGDYEDNIRQISKAVKFAAEAGVSVSYGAQPSSSPVVADDTPAGADESDTDDEGGDDDDA